MTQKSSVPGFPFILIDTSGHVWGKNGPLKGWTGEDGYKYVTATDSNGMRNKYPTHRLMAKTFLGYQKHMLVIHKDGNKSNNSLDNLECVNYTGETGTVRPFMGTYKDITGEKFGYLTAIRPTKERKNEIVLWLFKCDCGNEVTKWPRLIKIGSIKNHCGCIKKPKKPSYRENRVTPIQQEVFDKKLTEKIYIIYMATSPSGKKYVGYTRQTLLKRKYKHLYVCKQGNNSRFYTAIRKYGESIKWEVLHSKLNHNEACALEKELIERYDLMNPKFGYNMTLGGDGGVAISGDSEIIRIQKLKDYYNSDEMRKLQSNKIKAWHDNPDNIDIKSLVRGGKPFKCLETGKIFINIGHTARCFGGSGSNLRNHLQNKRKSFRGHHFTYIIES